jgi:hypothetical protein
MEKTWVHLCIKSFITSRFLHDPKGPIFILDVVVINLMWEIMPLNVIGRPTYVVVEFNAIIKIHEYRGFHEGHHFSMVMEV